MPRAHAKQDLGRSVDNKDRYQNLLRVLLHERSKQARESKAVAFVSAHRGAGVSYLSTAIKNAVNTIAVKSEVSHMAAVISDAVNSSSVYSHSPRIATAIREAMNDTSLCIEPSKLAIALDYRGLSEPGAEFGTVVADSLEPQVLRAHTAAGPTVQSILNGLPVEWSDESNCRKECLRTVNAMFRLVLIDVPSLGESSDICDVAPLVGGVVVVVEANRTTAKQLSRLTETIKSAHGVILGYVLNKRTYPIPDFLYRILESPGG